MEEPAPYLPHPLLVHGRNHIPPPTLSDFDSTFGGYLPSGHSISSSWGSTHYYEFVPSSAPSSRRIVLVHGGGTCAIGMAPLAFALTSLGHHVIIYDLWGHGLSSTPLETHTPALLHSQLLELLAHLGWTKIHLLGFSLGGAISATFTARHPEVVESLTLLAGAGLWRRNERSWWDGLIIDGGWGLEGMSHRKILAYVEGTPPIRADWRERLGKGDIDTAPIQKWQRDFHKGHVISLVSMFRCCVYDIHQEYERLVDGKTPVLVILGKEDDVIESEATKQELLKMGWKGEINVIDGATHNVVRSHVREIVDLLGKFLSNL